MEQKKYFINWVVDGVASPHEVMTKCYPFMMDDITMFAHREIGNPKIWVVTEFSTGLALTRSDTKRDAIAEAESFIRSKPAGWLRATVNNAPKLFAIAAPAVPAPVQAPAPVQPVQYSCDNCARAGCKLLEGGFTDLCTGKGFVQKGVSSPLPVPIFKDQYTIWCEAHPIKHSHAPVINKITPEQTKQSPPKCQKGALPDFWTRRPSARLVSFRDNSKYIGYYDPESVSIAIEDAMQNKYKPWDLKHGYPVFTWEYRAYKEDPDTPRRIYTGDDNQILESELDHYKDGGYTEDDDGQPALVTPYDAGLDPDDEVNENKAEPQLWRQMGVNHHKQYQHNTVTTYVIAGSYSRTVNKVVYEAERSWVFYPPWGQFIMKTRITRNVIEYREDNTVMRKQFVPNLHPIMIGQEAGEIGSSTPMTKKDRRFLEVRRYEKAVVDRHAKCLIHMDGLKAKEQVTAPA